MVCKEDVVSWFKELESYKRIDAMCTLLNMCLPFELRFIGTYLEELGKRDFQELRGAELRANNPTDLAADIGGANTDPRTRRKMALYVSLLRSCNFACATTLYNAMVSLEQSGLLKGLYGDLLEEILLLYTMALHHPAFTFDQKSHFGEILEKLKLEDQRIQFQEQPEHINVAPPPSTDSVPELSSPPVLTGAGGVVPLLGEVTHPPPGLPMPQYNLGEYMGQHAWPGNIIVPQPLEVLNYPVGAGAAAGGNPPVVGAPSSPLVSPGDSRAASPRSRRRLSRDRSPPPPIPPHDQGLALHFETLALAEMEGVERLQRRHLGDERLGAHAYRSLEKLNGVRKRSGAFCPARSSSDSGSSAASSPPGTPAPPRRAPPPLPFVPYPRPYAYPGPPPAYRPPPPPFANGEPPPYPAPQFTGFVPVLYAPPKLSCWNCGAAGHAGHECKEPSMEEMTRAGGYQLDFGGAPPDVDK
ncbi:sine oculis-binding protein homolog isoform X2 [Plodia interpunctella]|uniref:sine oculis-binding protein homolog isoform X2 n=1 Tax=Plodia interpunctella TaxID=58824 RepID=UPI002367A4D4|nr:sine oculis-binding protein homolog isoform X2 [Plodia interpunctella]